MRVFLSTGELSGDYHAAHLARELRRQAAARGIPLTLAGAGSLHLPPLLDEQWADTTTWAGIGFIESSRRAPRVALAALRIHRRLKAWRPDLVIAVDYRVMNVRLLGMAKKLGAKTAYYFPPVHWGSTTAKARKLVVSAAKNRKDRFDQVAAVADEVLLTYPISEEHYRRAGARVTYIGHPLANALESELTRAPAEVRAEWGLAEGELLVGILPGSRDQELRDHLPVLLPVLRTLGAEWPTVRWYVSVAHPRYRPRLERALASLDPALRARVRLIEGSDPNLLAASDLLLMKSGTSAQTALMLGVPMVTFYRITAPGPLQPLLIAITHNFFIKLDYWSFPNLLAGRQVVPECIQERCTPAHLIAATRALLADPAARAQQRAELLALRATLYRPDAIEVAARRCLDLIAPPVVP